MLVQNQQLYQSSELNRHAVPFSNVGVDFAGPLFTKEGKETRKVYITLWTCCLYI